MNDTKKIDALLAIANMLHSAQVSVQLLIRLEDNHCIGLSHEDVEKLVNIYNDNRIKAIKRCIEVINKLETF